MNRLLGVAMLAGTLFTALSCGDDDGMKSGPGTLRIVLTAPAANADSAILFTITGPAAPASATAGAGLRLFQSSGGGASARYALIGPLANGATILTLDVQDVSAVAQYQGTVDGVAQPNYQLRALNGYALAITR